MKREVQVISYETDKPVHTIDVSHKSDDMANRIVRGMDINLDHKRFYVKIVRLDLLPDAQAPVAKQRAASKTDKARAKKKTFA